MAHACQVGLGGMTSRINRRYRLPSEARTRTGDEVTYMFFFFFLPFSPAGKRQMRWASFGQNRVSWVSSATERLMMMMMMMQVLILQHGHLYRRKRGMTATLHLHQLIGLLVFLKVHYVVWGGHCNQKRKIFIDWFFVYAWTNKTTTLFLTVLLCLYFGGPCQLLASNSDLIVLAHIFSYGQNKYLWVCINTSLML